ncbi:MAG: M36 family metallopeptidase [Verrucomicrobiota bacterium]
MRKVFCILSVLLIGVWPSVVLGFRAPEREPLPNLDSRPQPKGGAAGVPANQVAAVARLQAAVPGTRVDFDPLLGTPRFIAVPQGFLSGPDGVGRAVSKAAAAPFDVKDPHRATKAFLQEHSALFGHGPEALNNAKILREYTTPHNRLRTVVWQQHLDGVPVFEAVLVSHTTHQNELAGITSQFVPNLAGAAKGVAVDRAALLAKPTITAAQAVALAAGSLGEDVALEGVAASGKAVASGAEQRQQYRAPGLNGETEVKYVWLPLDANTVCLCWEVVLTSRARGETFRVLVDAQTGEVRVRHGLTSYYSDAAFRVYTSDSPSPFSPAYPAPTTNQPPLVARVLVVTNALNTNSSPAGWISDGGNETLGNNVDAHLDRDGNDLPDLPRPQGSPARVFDFPLDLAQSPTNSGAAAVVQLFYWCNWMHDKLYELGFTEAAGNFQTDNFGRGGQGNDAVLADAQDGSGFNNANMSVNTDGTPPRMQMYLFNGPTPNRDGDLDAEIVLHEYTHGLTGRLVGGGVGITALQSTGMGEGWSDFYALSLLSEPGDDVNGTYPAGGYATYLMLGMTQNYYYGIRRYPYTTDLGKNPLTFKDIDPTQASQHPGVPRGPIPVNIANEIHNMGEVWCVMLWEARANFILKYGHTTGNQRILQLVTDGLKLSPANPTYIQARDAILLADRINNGGTDQRELWQAFAKRGLGVAATAPNTTTTSGVVESYEPPDDLGISPQTGFVISGEMGGPFNVTSQTYGLSNRNASTALTWTASWNVDWLQIAPASGTLAPGQTTQIVATLHPIAYQMSPGDYFATLAITNQTSGYWHQRQSQLRIGQPDYFTELFVSNKVNDLAYQSFSFIPNGSASFYRVCREPATAYPTDPAGGTVMTIYDDDARQITLGAGQTVALYNRRTNVLWVGSNGYITLNTGDTSYVGSISNHFRLPRISALFEDLNPSLGGAISYKLLNDRVAVTWDNVPKWNTPGNTNQFQVELFTNGVLRITYLRMDAKDGLMGLSAGTGVPANFGESDLTSYPICAQAMTVQVPASATEGDGTLAGQGQVRIFAPPVADLVVYLNSSDLGEITLPATVTIPASQTNALFDITIVNNGQLDGSQTVWLTASAAGYYDAVTAMVVHDHETTTLHLDLPATVREGDEPVSGRLWLDAPPVKPVTVSLTSSDPATLQTPSGVVVPAGQTSAVFTVSAVDDTLLNGTRLATVSAGVTNWIPATAVVAILDNERTNLVVLAPAQAREGNGTLTNAGQVVFGGVLTSNVTVGLSSSDLGKATVPASITVLAGQSNAWFNLTIVDNTILDGPKTVTLNASAVGFAAGSVSFVVADNESPLAPANPSPPDYGTNVSRLATLVWDSGALPGELITNAVYCGTNPYPGVPEFLGFTTNTSWTLPMLAPATTYYWKVIGRLVGLTEGPVWRFTTRGLGRFEWSPVRAPQFTNTPFTVTVTAKDADNLVVTNYAGNVSLSAKVQPATVFLDDFEDASFASWVNGTGAYLRAVTNGTAAHGTNSFTLIGGTQTTMDGVTHTLANLTPTRINFYVRASETNKAGGYFVAGSSVGLVAAFFVMNEAGIMGIYEDVNGLHGRPYVANRWYKISLALDWSAKRVDFYVDDILIHARIPFRNTALGSLNLIWLSNYHYTQAWWDEIEMLKDVASPAVTITPTNAPTFSNGSWTGNLVVISPATNICLRADDGLTHLGISNPFEVRAPSPPQIVTPPSAQLALRGETARFQVSANGTAPLAYQWFFNTNQFLANTLDGGLTLSNLGLSRAGYYLVVVTNGGGAVTSPAAPLTVLYRLDKPQFPAGTTGLQLPILAEPGWAYWLEASPSLNTGAWTYLTGVTNTNGVQFLRDATATNRYRFYRLGTVPAL